MKKIIPIIICMAMASPTFAQLNVQSQAESFNRIGTLRSSYAFLYNLGSTYYLGIRTSNQFDKGTFFALGKTAESSILTAQDLIETANLMDYNASINVKDAEGAEALIVKKTMLGKPYLVIKMVSEAGESNITCPELEKAIKLIKKHARIEN